MNNDGIDDIGFETSQDVGPFDRAGRTYIVYGRADTDDDGDGLLNSKDNCQNIANGAQIDADNDGYGNVCDADINNDCATNAADLGLLRVAFFSADPVADFNSDGVVNTQDLGILRARFFAPPGPSGVTSECTAELR